MDRLTDQKKVTVNVFCHQWAWTRNQLNSCQFEVMTVALYRYAPLKTSPGYRHLRVNASWKLQNRC